MNEILEWYGVASKMFDSVEDAMVALSTGVYSMMEAVNATAFDRKLAEGYKIVTPTRLVSLTVESKYMDYLKETRGFIEARYVMKIEKIKD